MHRYKTREVCETGPSRVVQGTYSEYLLKIYIRIKKLVINVKKHVYLRVGVVETPNR